MFPAEKQKKSCFPHFPESQDAYRGETGCLHGLMIVIHTLETITNKSSPSITIACHGGSARIKNLHTHKDNFSTAEKCFDLISRLIDTRNTHHSTLLPIRVRRHQDEVTTDLTLLEDWNVQMDGLAKRYIIDAKYQQFEPPHMLPLTNQGITTITFNDQYITTQ